jgi:hypothetical protein
MAKSLRETIESLLFAGMKPGAPPSAPKKKRWLDPLRQPLERFLNAGASNDPLYLSNRTWRQRARVWVLFAVPCVLVAGLIAVSLLGLIRKRDAAPKELTPEQMAAKILPADLTRNLQIHMERDLEVTEVRVNHAGSSSTLVGRVRNLTDKAIAHGEVIFDLADQQGSNLGAASAEVERVPPRGAAAFQVPIDQATAAIAIVREVRTQ